jgi:hypothetical protein
MFHAAFYPTPKSVVEKMIAGLNLDDAYVLEPSAGKGDILDVIKHKYENDYSRSYMVYHTPKMYAVELVPDLRAILESKGYPLVGEDFLKYTPLMHFTHILMNPPFDRAEEHLLHAWNILWEGDIACVYPKASLEGKTIQERTLLKIIADHGTTEDIGRAFTAAERTTNVECVIVRLKKQQGSGDHLDFDVTNNTETPQFDEGPGGEVALRGWVDSLLANHTAAVNNYADYKQQRARIVRYVAPFGEVRRERENLKILKEADARGNARDSYNVFAELLTEAAWAKIMDHPGFQSILTERARNMMAEFRARQRRVDFNAENVRAFFEALMGKTEEIMLGAVLDAFDTMTEHHEENRIYFEGWKSNKAWRVNKKVVLPHFINFDQKWNGPFRVDYHYQNKLMDIDRAMCVVNKCRLDDIRTVVATLDNYFHRINDRTPGETDSTFFRCRWFKKQTLHLTFKDERLLDEFNRMACLGRNWLPPSTAEQRRKTPDWNATVDNEGQQEPLF